MFKQYIFLLILSLFSAQSFAGSCPDGSEPVKSISADGTYFVFECSSTMETEGNLIKYNFNKGVGTPFCDDSRGYCASWKVNASKKCKDNYRFGENYSSTQERLNYEACIEQIEFKPFIGTKLNRSSNASPTMNEKANADRLIKAGWDKPTLVQPKIIAASDVPKVIKDAVKEGLNASIERLGNYGPLKIYIIGNDDSIIEPIIKDFCNWSKDKSDDFKRCSDDQGEGMREMAYIFPGGNGFADHGWNLQKPTQTFVLNPTAGDSNEFLALKYDNELQYEKVVTAHEYFHVYQAAHTVFRGEENSVYSVPRWMEESNASYFSWVTGSENGWIDINDRIVEIVQEVSNFRDRVPGMTIIDIESESGTKRVKDYCAELCIGSLQYSYALIATILLAQKTSDDALFVDFYKNHKDLGWMEAFKKTFKISVDEFYLQLEDFLNNPVKFQIEQLTISSDFKEQPEVEVKDSKLVFQSNSLATKNNNITIVNKSSFPTKILQKWTDSASVEMASRESDVFVLIYDVGKIIEPIQEFAHGALYEVLMSTKEINESKKIIKDWFNNSGCGEVDRHLLNEIIEGLEKGADWSRQVTLCANNRFIIMGVTDDMRNHERGKNYFYADLQEFLQHELYHSFQHDIHTGQCRDLAERSGVTNSKWMVEGGARFFAKYMLIENADTYSISSNLDSLILKEVYRRNLGNEAIRGSSDFVGSAALLLMTKRNLIKESEILDGSFFHDCAREFKFDKNSSEIKFILKNWNNIIRVSEEEYEFSPEVLLDYDPSKPSKVEYKEDARSEEYPTVDYNTNLLEVCKRDVEGAWKNDIKANRIMFAVAGEDGRCEYGGGPTLRKAFDICTKWQEENNIVGTCELYGRSGEVVWDGSVWDD